MSRGGRAHGPRGGRRPRWRSAAVVGAAVALLGAGTAAGLSFATSPPRAATVVGGPGGGLGTAVAQDPVSVAVDGSGGLAVGDGTEMVVRSLTASGTERDAACAGNIAVSGYGGDGGPATDASCDGPDGLVVDGAGNLFMADDQNNRIRVVAAQTGTQFGTAVTAGDITTIAGTGAFDDSGDGGPATSAALAYPAGLALDASGNLLVCDSGNNVVRVVAAASGTFYGQAMTAGDIYTVAGDGSAGFGGDGGPATSGQLDEPADVTADAAGNLVIADLGNNRVRVVAVSNGTFYGQAMTAGGIYTVAGDGTAGFGGDGGPATSSALDAPQSVAVDRHGNLVIADTANNRVRVVAVSNGTFYGQAMTAGDIYTVAGDGTAAFGGDGGPALAASLSSPRALVVDHHGDLVVADSGNERVRIVAAQSGTLYGQPVTSGAIQTVAGTGSIGGDSGDGTPAAAAELRFPTAVATDAAGDLAVADQNGNRVRLVPAAAGSMFGQTMTAGDLVTVAGNGGAGLGGSGVPATTAALDQPSGVAFDAVGNLVVSTFADNQIFVVAAQSGTDDGQSMTAGDIYLLAGTGALGDSGDHGPALRAELDAPEQVAVDAAGNVVVAEFYGNRVRVVATSTGIDDGIHMRAGDIYPVAGTGVAGSSGDGGPATAATFQLPVGVAVDRFGNLVVGDYGNNRVRVVATATGTFYGLAMTAGDVYTLAGDGNPGRSGDDGPAPAAELDRPAGIAVDATGNVIVADSANNLVRVVAVTSGRFFDQDVTEGRIYTFAGGGTTSCATGSRARVPGTALHLSVPLGVAADGLLVEVADSGNNCVRQLETSPAAPGPPRSVTATAGHGSAVVSWSPPVPEAGPVTSYIVGAVGTGISVRVGAHATSATVDGLAAGIPVAFTVTADSPLGAGPASADSNEVVPR